jgi:hypothetical protein
MIRQLQDYFLPGVSVMKKYRVFIPPELPSDLPLQFTPELISLLAEAVREIGMLDGIVCRCFVEDPADRFNMADWPDPHGIANPSDHFTLQESTILAYNKSVGSKFAKTPV